MKHLFAANLFKVIAGIVLLGGISGCSVFDPAEEIPSYLHINNMSVNAASTSQGSSSSYITDAWVYMDGNLIGAYELPCTLPILAEGTHHFLVRGGVKMNGVGSTHAIYPFYKGWEGDITLTRAQTATLAPDPVLQYFPGAIFETIGNFENGQVITSDVSYGSTMLRRDTIDSYEGFYGYVNLNSTNPTHFVGRTQAYSLSAAGEVWLELNYKCNENFSVGIVGNQNDFHEWVVVEPSETWNKIYIRLTDVIANAQTTSPYQIYFAMHQQTVSQPYLYLDNIKILR